MAPPPARPVSEANPVKLPTLLPVALLGLLACGERPPAQAPLAPPAILLVTLDTTRADCVAPEAGAEGTPTLAALAARGVSFAQAYTTAPMTLPAHTSMLTGLYPAGHGIHENGRRVAAETAVLAERLAALGYQTAAVVSGAPLDSAYGLARGFATYDDDFGPEASERDAAATTDRALALLPKLGDAAFLWVHYFDPHDPYRPPEPYRSRFAGDPYRGEIAFVDHELGRLVAAFTARHPRHRLLLVGDHGEGRGDHGEEFHGHLLYQATLRVPLLVITAEPSGPLVPAGRRTAPVSTREVFATILGWAQGEATPGLLGPAPDLVLGEALKPYLDYGWQPQWAAVRGSRKVIRAGAVDTEIYDLATDPGEAHDLAPTGASIDREVRQALADYPLPTAGEAPRVAADEAGRAQLASLGYLVSEGPRRLRPDAPVPRRMTALVPDLGLASGLFAAGHFSAAVPVLERLRKADPGNLSVVLRLAVAEGALGHPEAARRAFGEAQAIDSESADLHHYRGLYALRSGRLEDAARDLETVLRATPDRLPALEGLAEVRSRQGREAEAGELWQRVLALEPDHGPALLATGEAAMARGDTAAALAAFERARGRDPARFDRPLELGVLYLAAGRFDEARGCLERVPAKHPGYAMALFKRAQLAVLAGEPDAANAIRRAREGATDETRELIARESLFRR